jgi:hypothetical protein
LCGGGVGSREQQMTFHRGDPWHTKHTRRQQSITSTLQRPIMQPPSTLRRAITRPPMSMRSRPMNIPPTRIVIRPRHTSSRFLTRNRLRFTGHPNRRKLVRVFVCKCAFLAAILQVNLRFEQQRFYNPHHHPEMQRTLRSPDRKSGTARTTAGCTMIRLCFV